MIEFAFQNWNVEYSWWCPNTIAADFVYDGKKRAPFTHGTQWFEMGVYYHNDSDTALGAPPVKNDFLYTQHTVRYSHLPELRGKKYIYPVMIRDTTYFKNNEQYGFDLVAPEVVQDVLENRARIVLLFPLEGTSGSFCFERDYEILDSWCARAGLGRQHVYYVHGNFKAQELSQNRRFTAIPINQFLCWVPGRRWTIPAYTPAEKNDLFLSYNRRPRLHRTILLCELIRSGLLDRGTVSYYGDAVKDSVDRVIKYGRPGLVPEAQVLDSLIPLELDMDLLANNPAWNVVESHYEKTFCSIVPETLYDPGTIFFSEKTWKTISVGHPFMLVSSPGMLAELRRQGYYTFGSWWDESYDSLPGIGRRIKHIVAEMSRLARLDRQELAAMRETMRPVLEHNQRLFNQQAEAACGDGSQRQSERQMMKIIQDIWNSF